MVEAACHDLGDQVTAGEYKLPPQNPHRNPVKDKPGQEITSRSNGCSARTDVDVTPCLLSNQLSPSVTEGQSNAVFHRQVLVVRTDNRIHRLLDNVATFHDQPSAVCKPVSVEHPVPILAG